MRFVVSRQYATDPDQTYVAAKVLHWTYVHTFLTFFRRSKLCSHIMLHS
jgi:hypothetical protein